jgi:hypothetical protein
MIIDSLLRAARIKIILVAAVVFFPTISLSQDISGIAGALISGAINAQRMQQYQNQNQNQNQQRYQVEPRRKGSRNSEGREDKQQLGTNRAAAVQEKREAFLKLAPAAKELIEDASTFVRENPSNPKLVEFIQKINDLDSAVAAEDALKLKPLMETLAGELRHEPGYEILEAARNKQKQEEAARYLPELVNTAKQQQGFIRYYITNNPTAKYTTAFIALHKELGLNIAAPGLDKLKALTSKVEVSIREAGLQSDYVKSKNLIADQSVPASTDKAVEKTLRKTAKNAFLFNGDPRDIVLIYNSSPRAPHITKNLQGAFEFEEKEARACIYQPDFETSQLNLLRQTLIEYKAAKIEIDLRECPRNSLLRYDVVAVERGQLVKMKPEVSIALYSEVESNHLRHLLTVSAAQLDQIEDARKKARDRVEKDIDSGTKEGYGILFVGSHATAICMVVKDKEKGHRLLLLNNIEKLSPELISTTPAKVTTLDEAYKALQRNECAAIYASGRDLKSIVTGLKKDDISYSASSLWFTDEEAQSADKTAQEQELIAKKLAAQNRIKLDTEEKLRMSLATEKQRTLQSEFGKIAASTSDSIANEVREAVDRSTDRNFDWQKSAAYYQFQDFVTWYQNQSGGRWELQNFKSEISDYGRAEFKGRILEAAFTKVSMRLRNRILGEYNEVCWIFGRMNDTEFDMPREPIARRCDQDAELTTWKKVNNFQSQWLAGS